MDGQTNGYSTENGGDAQHHHQNASKHVEIVLTLLDHLVQQGATGPRDKTSLSVLSAVVLLRRQVESVGKQCQYLDNRS